MTFASIESSINAATLGALGNASMIWSTATIPVIFDANYADPLGMAGNQPRATCASSLITALTVSTAVSINSVNYTVSGIEPDGAGITTLVLRRA